jgi:hypothetical protein
VTTTITTDGTTIVTVVITTPTGSSSIGTSSTTTCDHDANTTKDNDGVSQTATETDSIEYLYQPTTFATSATSGATPSGYEYDPGLSHQPGKHHRNGHHGHRRIQKTQHRVL